MKITEIELSMSLTIPYGPGGDYAFLKPCATLRAELEEGEDVDDAYNKLSPQVTALFLKSASDSAYFAGELAKRSPKEVLDGFLATMVLK